MSITFRHLAIFASSVPHTSMLACLSARLLSCLLKGRCLITCEVKTPSGKISVHVECGSHRGGSKMSDSRVQIHGMYVNVTQFLGMRPTFFLLSGSWGSPKRGRGSDPLGSPHKNPTQVYTQGFIHVVLLMIPSVNTTTSQVNITTTCLTPGKPRPPNAHQINQEPTDRRPSHVHCRELSCEKSLRPPCVPPASLTSHPPTGPFFGPQSAGCLHVKD